MFIIEKLINDHREAVERWEAAREKWLKKNEYYSRSDYEEKYPRPLNWAKILAKSTMIGIVVGILGVLIIGFAKEVKIEQANKPEPPAQTTNGKNCQYFNKGDKVRIQYGDHVGNVGTVIGGCSEGESYQVKIDDGSKANLSNDSNNDPVDVGGWTISVNDRKNLVTIEDK